MLVEISEKKPKLEKGKLSKQNGEQISTEQDFEWRNRNAENKTYYTTGVSGN
jgi:hypothetical protein